MRRDLPPSTDATTRSVVLVHAPGANAHQVRAIVENVSAAAIGCVRIVEEGLEAARNAAREHSAAGVLVVGAADFPYAFDARLARVAVESASIATISPFCDASAAHRLREAADAGPLTSEQAARLDRLAFLRGSRSYYDVGSALPQCCFIPLAALAELGDDLRGVTVSACIERLSRKGLAHVLADSVYVNAAAGDATAARAMEAPGLSASREAIVTAWRAGLDFAALPGVDARPVQLHVVHDLGGGTEKWLRDFAAADRTRINMVLKSVTVGEAMGSALALFTDVTDAVPLATWRLPQPIMATVAADVEYRRVLDEIVTRHCVDVLIVSSLIGHSLDALDTGLPTLVVTHDYFPYCPAINLYFGSVCTRCDGARIEECYRDNPRFNPFVKFVPAERIAVRERFLRLLERKGVTMVTPSRSVAENLKRVEPRFAGVAMHTVPHGYGDPLPRVDAQTPEPRLRIVVLGQLAVLKGSDMLRDALAAITQFADIWLLGPREVGETFRGEPHVHIVDEYRIEDLPHHIAAIGPQLGLLASIAPETFNYTLTELQMLGIPTAATRVGAFAERIRHGETGYLFDPDVRSLVALLREIDRDRETLARIRAALPSIEQRSAAQMVADYHALAPVVTASAARYALGAPGTAPAAGLAASADALSSQQMTLAAMWKEMRSLHLRLTLTERLRAAEQQQAKAVEERLEKALEEAQEKGAKQAARVADAERRIDAMQIEINASTSRIDGLLASTSWRVTAPIRGLGHSVRWMRRLFEVAVMAVRDPAEAPTIARTLRRAWRLGGMPHLKHALLNIEAAQDPEEAFGHYHRKFQREVRPRILERIARMQSPPLISVVVPTYNPPNPDMFRQMLHSVVTQLYPHWELCVVDDGSTHPWVFTMLREYAQGHSRIRLDIGGKNRGVSAALNRAVEMASGEFVVLLDHDDILEPQALFRFAESVIEEDPDFVYGDEVLVGSNGYDVRRYAYRPAFSLEHLRGHPYIVHPIGFRKKFLREIGGFNEKLRISQDYDLILRAAEKARTIVHIPEILYRWRIHGSSAGIKKQDEVMDTSRTILDAHLARCGEEGHTYAGVSFNYFDVRYPLQPGLKVAIVIPTKNHGELLRQCIESIWATVKDVAYEIVVVNHESDDPKTIAYLESIEKLVTIVPYEGKFNFSAINNKAVATLDASFTHVLFCNNDIEAYEPGWLGRMLALGQQRSIGAVGAKLFYPDRRTIQHAGVCIGAYGAAEHYGKRVSEPGSEVAHGFDEMLYVTHEVAAVTAACMLMRLDVFREVGGFDEAIEVGFGDVDLCLRAWQRGYRIIFCPYAALVHHESFTRGTSDGKDPHPRDSALYITKWKDLLKAGDPYYSPGLSPVSTTWAVKQPLHCSYEIRRRIVRKEGTGGLETVSFSTPQPEAARD